MNNYDQVMQILSDLQDQGMGKSEIAWRLALACEGWPYIFGDRGAYCTPAHRRQAYASKGESHPTIKSRCKNFEGTGSCSGCQYYPGGRTLAFDCRGFTYWVLLKVYSWKLMGAGATSQWNTEANWKAKGTIDTMPENTLVCLFVRKGSTMEHTGFGLNNETVECSAGVQHFSTRNKKWTHWAVPVCISGEIEPDEPVDPEDKPTLRRGDSGPYVTLAQTMLIQRAYNLGSYGADGKFGAMTEAAVREFQADWDLTVDGVIGPQTWEQLERSPVRYIVTIPNLAEAQANQLCEQYPGATKTEEGG